MKLINFRFKKFENFKPLRFFCAQNKKAKLKASKFENTEYLKRFETQSAHNF